MSVADTLSQTLTIGDGGNPDRTEVKVLPYLFVVLECSRLVGLPSRHCLDGVQELHLGRGPRREHQREESTVSLRLPDRWMSSDHALLRQRSGQWILEDRDSKNGTAINGQATASARLQDGDLIEVGHSLLRFRLLEAQDGPADATIDPEAAPLGMTTLVPDYASVLKDLGRVAQADIRVLLLGESGTGKEVLARAVHELSQREGDFVAVNCGALPSNLVESELFGHKKGAFSGAESDRLGLVRAADRGTLFLDEIGDLPASSQAALLRVLQEGEVHPVGAQRPIPVDLRLIAATHRDIDTMVAQGGFRHDLYARLSGYRMHLLPLRQRPEDIGLLIGWFLRRRIEHIEEHPGIDVAAALKLLRYAWPLNIRELESTLSTAHVLANGGLIEESHLPEAIRTGVNVSAIAAPPKGPLSDEDRQRRLMLQEKLQAHDGNISAVARDLGKDRKQIQRWLERLAIDASRFRS